MSDPTAAPIRLGTRGSQLARIQADMVRRALQTHGIRSELVVVKTSGDVKQDAPIHAIGTIGAFTKELDDALLSGTIDAAVHSLKDLPTIGREPFAIAGVLPRDAAGDALVGAPSIDALRVGARVGTSSLRRVAQIRRARRDVEVVPLRGNVPTRIARVESGELDAALLSMGGLVRLGAERRATALDPFRFPHAPGQGVVAIVTRAESRAEVPWVDHTETRIAAQIERGILAALGGGCMAPIGAFADVQAKGAPSGASPTFRADVAAQVLRTDGREAVEARRIVEGGIEDMARATRDIAHDLVMRGAALIIQDAA
ncbi:MAG: hydroxymethylbilane synthase [Thermoplasmatota archaeon]